MLFSVTGPVTVPLSTWGLAVVKNIFVIKIIDFIQTSGELVSENVSGAPISVHFYA